MLQLARYKYLVGPACCIVVVLLVLIFFVLETIPRDVTFDISNVKLVGSSMNSSGLNATIDTIVIIQNNNYFNLHIHDVYMVGTHQSYIGTLLQGSAWSLKIPFRGSLQFHFPISLSYELSKDNNRLLLSEITSKCSESLENTIPIVINVIGSFSTWIRDGTLRYETLYNFKCQSLAGSTWNAFNQ